MALYMSQAAYTAESVTAQVKEPHDRWARRSASLLWAATLLVTAVGA